MSGRLTAVTLPGSGWNGWAEHGRVSPDQVIAEARRRAAVDLQDARDRGARHVGQEVSR